MSGGEGLRGGGRGGGAGALAGFCFVCLLLHSVGFMLFIAKIRTEPLARTPEPVLNWANVCSPEHTSDTSTNYDSFLN